MRKPGSDQGDPVLEGLYTAAAGMAAQQQRLDSLSNDVANVNTAGYKRVRMGFRDLIYQQDTPGAARTGSGAAAVNLGRDSAQGSLQQTDNPLDMAIAGDAYFQVRRPNGQLALTRNGAFSVGRARSARDEHRRPPRAADHHPRGTDQSSITISSAGVVTAGARRLGQISLVTVAAPTGLASAGDSLYTTTTASGPARRAVGATLQQRALEGSDVDLSDTMVDIMDTQRSYSMTSKAISMQDQMWQIANGVKQ